MSPRIPSIFTDTIVHLSSKPIIPIRCKTVPSLNLVG